MNDWIEIIGHALEMFSNITVWSDSSPNRRPLSVRHIIIGLLVFVMFFGGTLLIWRICVGPFPILR